MKGPLTLALAALLSTAALAQTPPSGAGSSVFDLFESDKDGRITARDRVFGKLRGWQDRNGNGISERSELSTLRKLGVVSMDLRPTSSDQRDGHGNGFYLQSRIRYANGKSATMVDAWLRMPPSAYRPRPSGTSGGCGTTCATLPNAASLTWSGIVLECDQPALR